MKGGNAMDWEFELQKVGARTAAVIDKKLCSNAGGVALKRFILAIDPTMKPPAARAFRQKIERRFGLPVKFLLITHYHDDHVFGAAPFKDACIIGSRELATNILERRETDWSPQALEEWKRNDPDVADWAGDVEILVPSLCFRDRLEVRDDDLSVTLVHAGGHTSCSAYAYFPNEKVVFAGDLLFAHSFPYAGDETCDPERWMEALREILTLDFEKLVPGHGPVVGKDEVENHLRFFEALREETIKAVKTAGGPGAIRLPEFYPLTDESNWRKTTTTKRWYEFYHEKADGRHRVEE
jgi:glyoxylase-like metal-dependent hydrolase (beta-lactamase superfamily II)